MSVDELREEVITLARFEGRVLEVTESEIVAVVTLQLDDVPFVPEEEATIPLDEIAAEDLPLVKPGAFFDWMIRSCKGVAESVVEFPKREPWTSEEIEAARRVAREC